MKRVVVTGVGNLCAFGRDWPNVRARFAQGQNATRVMPEWSQYADLESRLAAPLSGYAPPAHWSRKQLRSMGPVAQYAVDAAEQALRDAGLLDDASIRDGRMGVAAGSSIGSTRDVLDLGLLIAGQQNGFNANTYVRMMQHTIAANIAIFFGLLRSV